jgi:hypothetical protein
LDAEDDSPQRTRLIIRRDPQDAVISTEHEGAKRLRGSGETPTRLCASRPTQGVLPTLCPPSAFLVDQVVVVADESVAPTKCIDSDVERADVAGKYLHPASSEIHYASDVGPPVCTRFACVCFKGRGTELGRTPRIGMAEDAAAGSLHSPSVAALLRSRSR